MKIIFLILHTLENNFICLHIWLWICLENPMFKIIFPKTMKNFCYLENEMFAASVGVIFIAVTCLFSLVGIRILRGPFFIHPNLWTFDMNVYLSLSVRYFPSSISYSSFQEFLLLGYQSSWADSQPPPGPHLQHMKIPRLGAESEQQLLASATVTATPDLSCVHDSLWQCWILNPLSGARDWICNLMDTMIVGLISTEPQKELKFVFYFFEYCKHSCSSVCFLLFVVSAGFLHVFEYNILLQRWFPLSHNGNSSSLSFISLNVVSIAVSVSAFCYLLFLLGFFVYLNIISSSTDKWVFLPDAYTPLLIWNHFSANSKLRVSLFT